MPFMGGGLVKAYWLDRASVLAAEALRLPEDGIALDACAAPGGKSLALVSRLIASGSAAGLLANEWSAARRRRLRLVLDEHLDEAARGRVTVSGFDAAALAGRPSERGRFGAVLLDAPCSADRHVLGSPAALAAWTPARPRFLAGRQWALLSACFLMLRPGGSLVYATCALSEEENDGVAGRLVKKYGAEAALDPPGFPEGEPTRFGRITLPDACGGMGPLYVARFTRAARSALAVYPSSVV